MAEPLQQLSRDVALIKQDLALIKKRLNEDFELSDDAEDALQTARETPESQYVVLE